MNLQNFRGINFRFSDYISDGFNFYKENFSKIFVASLLMLLMSLIPLCGYLAIGNFVKFMKKLRAGQNPDASQEIFNFDDFVPYIKMMAAVFVGVVALEVPLFMSMGIFSRNLENFENGFPVLFFIYMLALMAVLFWVLAKAFYMPWLISVKKITSVREAWKISSAFSKHNIWKIISFMLVISILGEIGLLACGIGIIFTIPFYYAAYYFAMEDGMKQAESQIPSTVEYFK